MAQGQRSNRAQSNGQQKKEFDAEDRLKDYVDVPERIRRFYAQFPEGRLTRLGEPQIVTLERVADVFDGETGALIERHAKLSSTFVQYTAAAYRNPDDPHPGIGTAWEPFPGRTPYTKDSELMNAETSAWGRAIVAVGIIAQGEKLASTNEVLARHGADQAVTHPVARENAAAALSAAEQQAPPATPAEQVDSEPRLRVLFQLATGLPSSQDKSEEQVAELVTKRVTFYRDKKKAADPYEAVLNELSAAHVSAFGEDIAADTIGKAKALLAEPAATAAA